jgi:hypothetical protein
MIGILSSVSHLVIALFSAFVLLAGDHKVASVRWKLEVVGWLSFTCCQICLALLTQKRFGSRDLLSAFLQPTTRYRTQAKRGLPLPLQLGRRRVQEMCALWSRWLLSSIEWRWSLHNSTVAVGCQVDAAFLWMVRRTRAASLGFQGATGPRSEFITSSLMVSSKANRSLSLRVQRRLSRISLSSGPQR